MTDKYIAKKYATASNLTDRAIKCPNCHQPMTIAGSIIYCLDNPKCKLQNVPYREVKSLTTIERRSTVEAMRLAGLALTEMNFPGSPFGAIRDELYAAWKRAEAALVTAPSSSVSETEIRNQALEEALIYIQRFCRGRLHVGSDPSKVAAKVCYDKASTALASNHSEPDIEAQGR